MVNCVKYLNEHCSYAICVTWQLCSFVVSGFSSDKQIAQRWAIEIAESSFITLSSSSRFSQNVNIDHPAPNNEPPSAVPDTGVDLRIIAEHEANIYLHLLGSPWLSGRNKWSMDKTQVSEL